MTPDTYPLIPADARITVEPPMLIVDGLELSVTSVQADRLRQLTRGLTGRVPLSAMALSDEDAALVRQLREQGLLFDLRISADSVPTGQFCDYLHARITRWRTRKDPGRWPWRDVIARGEASTGYLQGILTENYHYVRAAAIRQSPLLSHAAQMLPELLALNSSGHPNGHTPYSAYLAFAALLVGYLRGNPVVVAGNSRSDDEPNVRDWHGMPVNHQWTKSHEFEAALGQYRDRWLPGAPLYSSPLRPLLELQIIRSLAPHMDAYLQTASCNKSKGFGWCRKCAKCVWVFLATSSLFGRDIAVSKAGGDLFADPMLSGLYEAMAGLRRAGEKPFECTGTEEEVRSAIQAAGKQDVRLPALSTCLRDPAVQAARPLDVVLKDWGQDDLLPEALKARVRRAAHL